MEEYLLSCFLNNPGSHILAEYSSEMAWQTNKFNNPELCLCLAIVNNLQTNTFSSRIEQTKTPLKRESTNIALLAKEKLFCEGNTTFVVVVI